jgi:hypothetical protein
MRLPSPRSLAKARRKLGSFDRFLLLYGAMFAGFGVASPFLPALLRERGLGLLRSALCWRLEPPSD